MTIEDNATYAEWVDSATEHTAIELGLTPGVELPYSFLLCGVLHEAMVFDEDRSVVYRDERGRAVRVYPR